MVDYLDQVGLWACLWENALGTKTQPRSRQYQSHGLVPRQNKRESKLSIRHASVLSLFLTRDVTSYFVFLLPLRPYSDEL